MAITLTLPKDSGYSASDIADIVGFLAIDSEVDSLSPTKFTASGMFNGLAASYTATGTGFSVGLIGADAYIVTGTLDAITMKAGADTITFTTLDIDMSVFSPIVHADATGTSPLGIENYLLGRDWVFNLTNQDDIAPKGTLIGDGAPFNPTGNDIFRAFAGNDDLFGGDGKDKMFGGNGADTLDGGRGNDVIRGGNGADRLIGGLGADRLEGQAAADTLLGGGGKDVLIGGIGNDKLNGGAGNDKLNGGAGRDVLIGGGGADDFVFANGGGTDRIKDFNANNNNEEIVLRDVTAIKNFADLSAHHMTQVGSNVVIDDHAGLHITLVNVDINDLNPTDFIF